MKRPLTFRRGNFIRTKKKDCHFQGDTGNVGGVGEKKPHLFWSSTVDIGIGLALVTLRASTLVTTATPSSTVISYRTVQHAWS